MPAHRQTTHTVQPPPAQVAVHAHPTTSEERQERKQRIQTHGRSSMTRSIADAIVVKAGDLFFLSEPNGRVPLDDTHGYGLYYHDCRFLNGYELKLAHAAPDLLAATADRGFAAIIELTNPDLKMAHGQLIRKEQIGIKNVHAGDIAVGRKALFNTASISGRLGWVRRHHSSGCVRSGKDRHRR